MIVAVTVTRRGGSTHQKQRRLRKKRMNLRGYLLGPRGVAVEPPLRR